MAARPTPAAPRLTAPQAAPATPRFGCAHRRHGARGAAAWRTLVAIVLAAPLLVLALVGVLVGTSGGAAWLLAQVPGLKVGAPRGALLGGSFEAAHVEWSGT